MTMAPDQLATSPGSGSVVPSPSPLSHTITFHMKTGSASSGRMTAVYQRPCSAMISESALLRASISGDGLGGEVRRHLAFGIRRREPCLVGLDDAVDDRRGQQACERSQARSM